MQPWRTYIAAMEPLRYEAALTGDADFTVIGSSNGEKTEADILSLCPDLLILDGVLQGCDPLALLGRLGKRMPAPPRALYLGREESWLTMALQCGADRAVHAPCAPAELILQARQTAETPLPRLSAPWEKVRDQIASEYVEMLGIKDGLKGKEYIGRAASMLACAPQLGENLSQQLYPLLGKERGASPKAVERNIRTAVEYTWLHGNLNAIQILFGYSVDSERGKPTNAEFLSMLAQHTTAALIHKMEK